MGKIYKLSNVTAPLEYLSAFGSSNDVERTLVIMIRLNKKLPM